MPETAEKLRDRAARIPRHLSLQSREYNTLEFTTVAIAPLNCFHPDR